MSSSAADAHREETDAEWSDFELTVLISDEDFDDVDGNSYDV